MNPCAEADIIILSWNRSADTVAAIESAAEQLGVDKRILIVDQGSDRTNLSAIERCVQRIPCAELKKLGRNVGVAAGRNIATAMGRSRYVIALDSDAVFADNQTVARAVAHMNDNPNLCAIGFRILNYYTQHNDATSWDYPSGRSPNQAFASSRFIGAGHAIRRSTFESVGGYDDQLFFCGEETDLSYRMLNTGMRMEYFPEATVLHKISPEHRVSWDQGRFFYTVRNTLYTQYKFATPLARRTVAAAAFLVRGLTNRIPLEAARGIVASAKLCSAFRHTERDSEIYRLRPETWDYILECEPSRREGVLTKFRRQLRGLPRQAQT